MLLRIVIVCVLFVSCSQEVKKPNYIALKVEDDSIYVQLKNHVISSSFLKIENKNNNETTFLNFNSPDTLSILKFHKSEIDTSQIFKNYNFKLMYGTSSLQRYDTFYNYNLPFAKGKRYRVLQGNNGSFSHQKTTSKYAIDFTMNMEQEVCAIRNGIVIVAKKDSDEGGSSKKFLDKANKIFVFHDDGTFAQYAHFKKDGVLVKAGDTIKKGQLIGYSGNTGMSTQPHLHFVLYKPTKTGLVSIPFILDSIPTHKYKTGKYATNN